MLLEHPDRPQSWDIAAGGAVLGGNVAGQLGSLSCDAGIDWEIGKRTNFQSLEATPVKCEGNILSQG